MTTTATAVLPRAQTIFGREPVMFLGLVETILTFAMAFGLGISQEVFGPLMAVVAAGVGLYTAWATTETRLSAITGFMRAAIILAATFGLTLSDTQTGALITLVSVVFAWIHRDNTSPLPLEPTPVAPAPVTTDTEVPVAPAEEVVDEGGTDEFLEHYYGSDPDDNPRE